MRRGSPAAGIAVLFAALAAVWAGQVPRDSWTPGSPTAGAPPNPREPEITEADDVSYEAGRRIFLDQEFGGNGRTCATCHDPRNEFTISPGLVRARFTRDPSHPLFRALDSNDGQGRDYSNLLDHAVVRVTVPLHVSVEWIDEPWTRSVSVWRGVPTIANVLLTAPYLQDGRATNLRVQALGAVHDHFEPRREPRADEIESLTVFMREVFYPLRLRSLRDFSDPLVREPGFSVPISSTAALRGRTVFVDNCVTCHGGELAHRPPNPHDPVFITVFVSEANRPGFPLLRLRFKLDDGSRAEVETPDPGLAALTGRLEHLNAFETPQLRGLKHTAPYFHDNSAETLGEVIDHYNEFFNEIDIQGRSRDDLITYLEAL